MSEPATTLVTAPGPVGAVPRVSVIVPVRGRRKLLRATLDALAAQTLVDHEVLVVDDGSTDGAGEEAEEHIRLGRPVRLLSSGGSGAVAARRLGVAAARADLLAFTDSDCVPDPQWLAAGVAALDDGLDVAQGSTVPSRPLKWPERSVYVTTDDGLYATCNVFYRRQAFDQAGGFDQCAAARLGFRPGSRLRGTGFGEDTLLGWKVRRQGRSGFVSMAIVRHHVFEIDLRESLRRAWSVGAFPALVREVPELRQTLLCRRVFLERPSRVPLYAAAAAVAIRRPGLGCASLGGWLLSRAVAVIRSEPTWRRRIKVLPVDVALEGVTAVALGLGSVKATTPVL